jgi:hypothetical protein
VKPSSSRRWSFSRSCLAGHDTAAHALGHNSVSSP